MTMREEILEGLTEPQRQAVTHVEGPLLVLAGPGSGKTRVITRRVANLVLNVGIAPWNVLAITFTNKAASEMQQRVAQLLSPRQARAVAVSTFHSFCARTLRFHCQRLNLPPGYTIYDSADQQRAIKRVIEESGLSTQNFQPGSVLANISNAKNELKSAEQYAQGALGFYEKNIAKLYERYQKILRQSSALDFDDLLMRTVELLREHPDVLAELRERHQYLLIDEYQDTNKAQFVLADLLASQHRNICATGDPDQSIYGWRGADISNILQFEQRYPNAAIVRLEQNYRSTKSILAAADTLIQQNAQRKHKALWTENESGEPVTVVRCEDERAEAQRVVEHLRKLRDEQSLQWSQMAVFYRVNSLSRALEEALLQAAVPYQVARGTAFYERKEIKDALAYLRVVANPADEVNLVRIINLPARGISAGTVAALQHHAQRLGLSLDRVLHRASEVTELNSRAVAAVQRFAQQLHQWRVLAGLEAARAGVASLPLAAGEPSLSHFIDHVLRDCGLEDYYRKDKTDPDQDRLANLGELVSSAKQYESDLERSQTEQQNGTAATAAEAAAPAPAPLPATLAQRLLGFLERVSLVSDVDGLTDSSQGTVTLMTLHAAKGLEFPAVVMVGVEEGLLPHDRAVRGSDGKEMEEERRLAFVGLTRAERFLMLTHARQRTTFGERKPAIPSRFLREMAGPHLRTEEQEPEVFATGFRSRSSGSSSESQEFQTPASSSDGLKSAFPPGTLVKHPTFGTGRVLKVDRMAGHTRAQVHFSLTGVKTLVLEYAQLERVS